VVTPPIIGTVHRFYAPELDASRSIVTLPADEAQHLTRVLRLGPGARVAVFNGRGQEFWARVEAADASQVSLAVLESREPARESRVRITLGQAVLKSDKMDDVVRDAVMLGVTAIQPIVASRVEQSISALQKGRRVERWQRVAVASAKQCGRAVVPNVEQPASLDWLVTRPSERSEDVKLALVEPSHDQNQRSLNMLQTPQPPAAALVLVGPEGGWTRDELEQLSAHNFHLVSLGSRTLRADAVPLTILALLQFIWGDF
jgi:16S rRNA (uracil1498-N3)-methyltransferase